MSVKYKLRKDTRQYLDKAKTIANPNYKKWNARAVHSDVVGLDELSAKIEQATTLTKADIAAVIKQFIVSVREELLDSKIVKLDGFGQFKVGLKTKYADTIDDFCIQKNVVGARVNFLPAYTVNQTTNERTVALIHGIKVKETLKNPIV